MESVKLLRNMSGQPGLPMRLLRIGMEMQTRSSADLGDSTQEVAVRRVALRWGVLYKYSKAGPPLDSIDMKLLGAKGIATRSKDATRSAPGLTTRSKKLLGAKGIATKTSPKVRRIERESIVLRPRAGEQTPAD